MNQFEIILRIKIQIESYLVTVQFFFFYFKIFLSSRLLFYFYCLKRTRWKSEKNKIEIAWMPLELLLFFFFVLFLFQSKHNTKKKRTKKKQHLQQQQKDEYSHKIKTISNRNNFCMIISKFEMKEEKIYLFSMTSIVD